METSNALDDLSRGPTMYTSTEDSSFAGRAAAAAAQHARSGKFLVAEQTCRRALALQSTHAVTHHNLGWLRQVQCDSEDAIQCYRTALQLDPSLRRTRRNLAALLLALDRRTEAFSLWHDEVRQYPASLEDIATIVSTTMLAGDLQAAEQYAWLYAALRWGTSWYPRVPDSDRLALLPAQPAMLTLPKLQHDIEQLLYLQHQGILGGPFTAIIKEYERVVHRLTPLGSNLRAPLTGDDARRIGHVYNRIIHIRDAPRLGHALATTWNADQIEQQYLETPPGLVVIDNFLSDQALENLRLFCLESTIWSTNRYAHGRLGSFFKDGFNCPLLLQIAQELRDALPRVIGNRYPLRQMWGFKYGSSLPSNTTHADFAAVNVNFWITPEEANLDSASGGLLVFDVEAPLDWNFSTYNRDSSAIADFLEREKATPIKIPYRQNRAVIFNSNLFHATDALKFRSGYEYRRINITMLYGDRIDAVHRFDATRASM